MAIAAARAYAVVVATITDTAQNLDDLGFTAAEVALADYAHISVETADIRYYYDGSTPTSSNGHLVAAGNSFVLEGRVNTGRALFIRSGGTSATAQITLSTN